MKALAPDDGMTPPAQSHTPAWRDLLGDVPYPTIPAEMDFRDAHDLVCAAILEAARRAPDRFFDVLERQPGFLRNHEVVWALGGVPDERVIPLLLGVLAAGDSLLRWSAAHGLEARRDPRVVDGFIAALRDRAPKVRAVVIEALGKMGAKRAVPALREAAERKSNANDAYLSKLIAAAIASIARPGRDSAG